MTKPSKEGFIISPDGTEIYYRVFSHPDATELPLVLHDGLACDGYIWKYVIKNFYKTHPIIHWNYRGHGQSSVPSNLDTVDMHYVQQDLQTLLHTLSIKKAIFCGHSMGVQVVLEAYKELRRNIAGYVLLCGGPEYPLSTWHAPFERNGFEFPLVDHVRGVLRQITKGILNFPELIHPFWKKAFQTDIVFHLMHKIEVNPKRVQRNDFLPYLDHLATMDPRVFAKMFNSLVSHSALTIMGKITKPTLIVSGGKDTFSPAWVGEDMHATIRNSEFLNIPDGTHVAPIEHPELINLRMEKFIRDNFRKSSRRKPIANSNTLFSAA